MRIRAADPAAASPRLPSENTAQYIARLFDAGVLLLAEHDAPDGVPRTERLVAWEVDEDGEITRCETEMA